MVVMDSLQENIHLQPDQSFRLLRWDHSVRRAEAILAPNRSVPVQGHGDHWHYHRATELTLVQRGTGTRFVADHIELFDAPDLVLIGANVPHYLHLRGISAGLSIQWNFPLEHGIWNFGETAPLRVLTESARRGLLIRGRTADLTRRRMEEMTALRGFARLAVFLGILADLVAAPAHEMSPLATAPFSLSGTAAHQEAIRRTVSYIVASYREPVGLPELLRLAGMSRATFARQFRKHTGKSFLSFLNQVRLQAVCRVLRESNESVSEIALDHGFNHLSYFNRLFRREFGVNPTSYRQSQETRDASRS